MKSWRIVNLAPGHVKAEDLKNFPGFPGPQFATLLSKARGQAWCKKKEGSGGFLKCLIGDMQWFEVNTSKTNLCNPSH